MDCYVLSWSLQRAHLQQRLPVLCLDFVIRTMTELHHHLDSLHAVIDFQFIPAITEGHIYVTRMRDYAAAVITIENARYVHSSLLVHCTVRICKFEQLVANVI